MKVFADPLEAARGSHLVTTDVWTSMGFEAETEARKKAFADWCVDEEMMALADTSAVFMHCLPAHRGEEVTAGVIDGPQSVVWDEARTACMRRRRCWNISSLAKCGRDASDGSGFTATHAPTTTGVAAESPCTTIG